tara:strand:- start:348 stop:1247 length:900 start_codon:yes stop_codon:yes gene_type:complete
MSVREFSDIIRQVRRVVDDSDGVRWKDDILNDYINEGQEEFCRETKTLRAFAPLTTRANSEIYALPEDLFETIRIKRSDGVEIYKSTSYDIAQGFGTYRGSLSYRGGVAFDKAVGIPTHYYQDLDGEKLLRFYPRPTDDFLAQYQPFEEEEGVTSFVSDINDVPADFNQEEGLMSDSNVLFDVDKDQLTETNNGQVVTDGAEDFTTFNFDEGIVTSILQTANVFNVWYVRYPRENKLEISDKRALRFYTLYRLYEEDSPFQNLKKSEFYNDKFWSRIMTERGRVQNSYGANQRVKGEYY